MVEGIDRKHFDEARARCITEARSLGRLSFRNRRHLLLALGPPTVGPVLSVGHVARTRLAVRAAERVKGCWEEHFEERHPHRLCDGARNLLLTPTKTERSALERDAYGFRGGLDNALSPAQNPALFAGHAAVCAAYVAVHDELLEPDEGVTQEELDDPEDPDLWDAAFWAAAAHAGDVPWGTCFDAARYSEFWHWYLTDALHESL